MKAPMTFAEIASVLGCSEQAAYMTFRHGIGKLRRNTPNAVALLYQYSQELERARRTARKAV